MPLISTFGSTGSQAFGNRGIQVDGSALFDAVADRLTCASSTAFNYGAGNFNIEGWFYPTSFGTNGSIIWRQDTSVWLYMYNNGSLLFSPGAGTGATTSNSMTLNAWNHVAVVRNAGSVRIFLNGVGYGAVANSTIIPTPAISPQLGCYDTVGNYQYSGYITNFRIAKQALYTANFDPSLIPFTSVSQNSTTTSLLLKMRNAGALTTDSSASNLSFSNVGVTFSTLTPYRQPYVTPPNIVVSSALVTPTSTTPTEGQTITINVVGTNTANGTYYYSLQEELGTGALTAADFSSASLTGSFSIAGNSGSFPLTMSRDLLTEGNETFTVYVRTTSTSGPIIGTSAEITISDTSLTPAFTVTPASINEGSAGSFTVANVGPDGTYFFTVLNGTTANADFSATSGSFVVSGSTGGIDNGTGSFNITTVSDRATEGAQTFQVQVRSGSTSGTVVVTSASVTVNDTSLTPAFTVTPASINEGSAGSFTVNNLGPAGTYFYTVLNGTTVDADFIAVSGSFITSTENGSGSFNITPGNDFLTEGAQTFQVQVRQESVGGTVLVTSSSVTVNDTSTTVTASGSPTAINEGASTTITASATAFPNGTYFWTILNGTTTNADFTAASGSFTVSNGTSGSLAVTASTLDGAEGTEFFQVQIRTGSTSGSVIATTGTLTINLSAT